MRYEPLYGNYNTLLLAEDWEYCYIELDIEGHGMHYQSGELWGSAYDTIIASGGVLQVASGGVADHTNILYKGYMEVSSGGTANQTTISSGGTMKVRSGGIVNEATTMHVDSMAAGGVEVSGGTSSVFLAQGTASHSTLGL